MYLRTISISPPGAWQQKIDHRHAMPPTRRHVFVYGARHTRRRTSNASPPTITGREDHHAAENIAQKRAQGRRTRLGRRMPPHRRRQYSYSIRSQHSQPTAMPQQMPSHILLFKSKFPTIYDTGMNDWSFGRSPTDGRLLPADHRQAARRTSFRGAIDDFIHRHFAKHTRPRPPVQHVSRHAKARHDVHADADNTATPPRGHRADRHQMT